MSAETQTRPRARNVNPGAKPDLIDFGNGVRLTKGELASSVAQMVNLHGNMVVMSGRGIRHFRHIRTGIFALDFALGGGIPEGLCTMIYGWPSGGKTTVTLRIIAHAQRKYPNMKAVYVDVEGTFDPEWAEVHGVDLDRLLLLTPASGEMASDFAISAVAASDVCIVAVDSIAMMTPMKEMDKSIEDPTVGGASVLVSRFLRKVNQTMLDERKRGHWPTLVLINQWRTKIGVLHGDPRTLPGGNALNYVASVKLEIKNKEIVTKTANSEQVVEYNEHSFKIEKNKIINGPRQGEFPMIRSPYNPLGVGFIDEGKTVITQARVFGLVGGGGGKYWFKTPESDFEAESAERFQTLDAMRDHFYANETNIMEPMRHKMISIQRGRMGKSTTEWDAAFDEAGNTEAAGGE